LGTGFSLKLDLNLVVSSKELEEKMLKTMPPEISGFTNIHCFHHGETLSRCLFSNKGFLDSVKHLCAFDDQIDKVETVAAVLLGAWKSIEKSSITVSDIIEKAKNHRPSFIRALSENYQPDSRLLKILDNIENFNYDIQKGFMRWTYRDGLERGVFPYDCESETFKKFQGYIIEKNPLKFEDIEQMLLFNPEGF
jgi:hypothetical protein